MFDVEDSRYLLPQRIRTAMFQDPILGVCVVFKDNKFKRWYSTNLSYSEYSLERLSNLMKRWKYSDFDQDFIILDGNGEVCCTNCKEEVTYDDKGLVMVGDNKYFVKIIKDKNYPQYVGGRTMEDIDKKVKSLVKNKKIKKLR